MADPLADKYEGLSPFNFVANNPIVFKDVDGLDFILVVNTNFSGSSNVTTETSKTYAVGEGKNQKVITEKSSATKAKVLDNTIDLSVSGLVIARDIQEKSASSEGSQIEASTKDGIVAFNVNIQMEARNIIGYGDILFKGDYETIGFESV